METEFKGLLHLSRAEYTTLSTTGTLTKAGVTYTFDPLNNEYIVPKEKLYVHEGYFIADSDGISYKYSVLSKKETALTINDWKSMTATFFGVSSYFTSDEKLLIGVYYDEIMPEWRFGLIDGDEAVYPAEDVSLGYDSVIELY